MEVLLCYHHYITVGADVERKRNTLEAKVKIHKNKRERGGRSCFRGHATTRPVEHAKQRGGAVYIYGKKIIRRAGDGGSEVYLRSKTRW